jgi:ABC-type glycerol-3-phosphate transport system permease component
MLGARPVLRRRIRSFLPYAGLTLLAAMFVLPIVWLVSSSFKSQFEFSSPNWIPQEPTLQNYVDAVTEVDFPHYLKNTVFLASVFTILHVLSSSLAGYAFARLRAPGRDKLFLLVVASLLVPQLVTFIPQFVVFSRLQLVNTYWPWIAWGAAGGALYIFLFRQFFLNFPRELEEAAEIDGCGPFKIYWRIFLPNSLPALATVAIFSFQWVWNDYLFAALLLDTDRTTLAVAIGSGYYDLQGRQLLPATMAGMVLYALPLIVVFFFIQRYIIQGIVTTGTKG